MPAIVVKLGSSIVAEDSGELRLSVLARICEEVAALHARRRGRRGRHLRRDRARDAPAASCRCARRAIEELQAASAVGQGRLYRTYDELLRERGVQTAQVLLTFFDMQRPHALPERAPHAADAARLADRAGDQRERHDHDRRDLLRRQRLPRRAGRDPARRADCCVLLTDTDGLYTADPRIDPTARLVEEVTDFEALEATADRPRRRSPLGSGGMRSKVVAAEMATAAGHRDRDRQRPASPACCARAWAGEPAGTRFPPQAVRHSSFKLWLKYAKPSHGTRRGRRGRRARAARGRHAACCRSASSTCRARSTPATRSTCAVRRRRAIGKGIANYSAAELRRVMGLKSAAGARGAAARDRGGRAPRLLRARLTRPLRGRPIPAASCTADLDDSGVARSGRFVHGDLRSGVAAGARGVEPPCRLCGDALPDSRHGRRPPPRPSATSAAPPRPPRARSRRPTPRPATARCSRSPTRSRRARAEILEANARDLEAGRESGLSAALMDRLALDEARHRRRSPPACARSSRCRTRSAR